MSNKATCPACGSHTSSVYAALTDGTQCPHCGLSAGAMFEFMEARKRGADEDLVERAAKAEQRAQTAERRARDLEEALSRIVSSAEYALKGDLEP